jgi:hypothetical protein
VYNLLLVMCKQIRYMRNFLTWQSAFTAKATTYALLLAAVWLVLPMNQVLQWYLRFITWLFLGPWMKWLDDRYFGSWYETKENLLQRIDSDQFDGSIGVPNFDPVLSNETFRKITEQGRMQVEDLCKLRDMRTFRFGSYSVKVPNLDNSRTQSIPLPESTAEITKEDAKSLNVLCHLPGQRLYGDMIHSTGNSCSDGETEDRAGKIL